MSSEAQRHRNVTGELRRKLAVDTNVTPLMRYALMELLQSLDDLSKRIERFENAEMETEG